MHGHSPKVLVLWDVDHTLVDSGGVSHETYALAFQLLFGRRPEHMPWIEGHTDVEVLNRLLLANDADASGLARETMWQALVEAASRNRTALRQRGRALPGGREVLTRLGREDGVIQSVLTGNIRFTATDKLAAFGLDTLLDLDVGSFGSETADRAALVPSAQLKAAARYGFDTTADVTVLIGDTPVDVRAALAHGARVIGVATGRYAAAELDAAGATDVVPDLTDIDGLVRIVTSYREHAPIAGRGCRSRGSRLAEEPC
jgi:phosphoglycolate phosphatase-like HAD superfamily hydrolase